LAPFFHGKNYLLIRKKLVGRFFLKLIWSPCFRGKSADLSCEKIQAKSVANGKENSTSNFAFNRTQYQSKKLKLNSFEASTENLLPVL
jgi:hypothetical protein